MRPYYFILFAEDRDLLRTNMIKEIREEFINQSLQTTLYMIFINSTLKL